MLKKIKTKISELTDQVQNTTGTTTLETFLHPFVTLADTHRIKSTYAIKADDEGVEHIIKNSEQSFLDQSKRALPNLAGTVLASTVFWGAVIGLSHLASSQLRLRDTNLIKPAFDLSTVVKFLTTVANNKALTSANWAKNNKLQLALYIGTAFVAINVVKFLIDSLRYNQPNHYALTAGKSVLRNEEGKFISVAELYKLVEDTVKTVNRKVKGQNPDPEKKEVDKEVRVIDSKKLETLKLSAQQPAPATQADVNVGGAESGVAPQSGPVTPPATILVGSSVNGSTVSTEGLSQGPQKA